MRTKTNRVMEHDNKPNKTRWQKERILTSFALDIPKLSSMPFKLEPRWKGYFRNILNCGLSIYQARWVLSNSTWNCNGMFWKAANAISRPTHWNEQKGIRLNNLVRVVTTNHARREREPGFWHQRSYIKINRTSLTGAKRYQTQRSASSQWEVSRFSLLWK